MLLGTNSIEPELAVTQSVHGHVGAGLAVQVLQNIGKRTLELSPGEDMRRVQQHSLDIAAGNVQGVRPGALPSGADRGANTGRRCRSLRGAVGRSGAIGASVGVVLGTPDGSNNTRLRLGPAQLGEQLAGLRVEGLGLGGGLGGGGSLRAGDGLVKILVLDLLNKDAVGGAGVGSCLQMLLQELRGS